MHFCGEMASRNSDGVMPCAMFVMHNWYNITFRAKGQPEGDIEI